MATDGQKLSVVEKVGYSLGDAAANFIFQTMLIFLMSFYTDVFGIPAAVVGTLFLVARVTDAIFDFGMGAIADRTNTRWGKFRPWVLWTAVPFGLLGYLTFSTPNLDVSGKIVYAYVTYILLMLVYSANNIPYSAMTGVLTGDTIERTTLSSYRFVAAMLANLAIQGLTLPLANALGHGDAARGYQATMGIFCGLAVIFFFITFATTKERVQPDPAQNTSLGQDLKDLWQSRPWVTLFVLTVLIFLNLSVRGSISPYYFRYFVTEQGEPFSLDVFGLPLNFDLFTVFNICGVVASIIGIFFSKPLAMRFGKRDTFRAALFVTAVFMTAFVLLPRDAVGWMFLLQILLWLAYGVTIPLLWAMMADVADYSEWRTRRRATGITFSGIVFGLKVGLGLGGALSGWLLARAGYAPNVAQSESALQAIRLLMSVIPALFFFAGVAVLFAYPIEKHTEHQMNVELNERRKSFQPAVAKLRLKLTSSVRQRWISGSSLLDARPQERPRLRQILGPQKLASFVQTRGLGDV
jgi:GPH family glycoside/pentoside/hexuronide:cation symporter